MFSIIQSPDGNVMGKKEVSVMILFSDLLNNFNFIDKVSFVEILYFNDTFCVLFTSVLTHR